jgi:F-type H+-transporting ATPase subunit a
MIFLGADFTWFNLVPGYDSLNASLSGAMGTTVLNGDAVHSITHLTLSLVATFFVVGIAFSTSGAWKRSGDATMPAAGFSARNLVELILDGALTLGEQVFGSKKAARRFLPLVGTLALYILFNNLLGLVPGFAPATDNLNVTIGPALVVFIATHIFGLKENGMHYLAHFLGPKIGKFPLLAPLMLPIEIISHLARPLSLSLRLMGNMTGDHAVLAIFLGLAAIPLFYPIPILVLGTIVCVVQTLVFCLLAMVYIALAIEHSEEAH